MQKSFTPELFLPVIEVFAVEGNVLLPSPDRERKTPRYSDCLVLVLEGECLYDFGSYHFTATPDTVVYLAHNSTYKMNVFTPQFKVLFVDFQFSREGGESTLLPSLSGGEALFRRLLKSFQERENGWQADCFSALYGLLTLAARQEKQEYVDSSHRRKLTGALTWMRDHFADEDFNAAFLADLCRMSQVHFRRLFREQYNMTPVKYYTLLRLERGKKLLRQTEKTVTEIAEACGYRNVFYFERVFKETVGLTPGEYRRAEVL